MYAPHPSFLTQPFPAGTGNGILFPWKARWRCSGCWEDVKTRQVKTGGPGSGIDYLFKQEPTGPCQRDTKPQRKYAHCFSRHLLLYIIYINPWSRVYALIMYLYGAKIVGPLRTRYFMLLQQILWAAQRLCCYCWFALIEACFVGTKELLSLISTTLKDLPRVWHFWIWRACFLWGWRYAWTLPVPVIKHGIATWAVLSLQKTQQLGILVLSELIYILAGYIWLLFNIHPLDRWYSKTQRSPISSRLTNFQRIAIG